MQELDIYKHYEVIFCMFLGLVIVSDLNVAEAFSTLAGCCELPTKYVVPNAIIDNDYIFAILWGLAAATYPLSTWKLDRGNTLHF